MASLSYSYPPASFDDPVFIRTHFLERVASEDLGICQQHARLKHRNSRYSDLGRWEAHCFIPLTAAVRGGSSESSGPSDSEQEVAPSPPSGRLSCSSFPPTDQRRRKHANSLSTPFTAVNDEANALHHHRPKHVRTFSAPLETRLMPAQPLTINTVQPLRLSSSDLCALSSAASAKPLAKFCQNIHPDARMPIECSESDGSCHGDAGDQDPEAQLAAGIVRLDEKAAVCSDRPTTTTTPATEAGNGLTVTGDHGSDGFDSDDSHSLMIQRHANSFIIRFAEAVLDLGSSTLETWYSRSTSDATSSAEPCRPPRRISTTPQQLDHEAKAMRQRRRKLVLARSRSSSTSAQSLPSWSTVPQSWDKDARPVKHSLSLLSLPSLLSPSSSLEKLASSALSLAPSTPALIVDDDRWPTLVDGQDPDQPRGFGVQHRQYSGYGLDTYVDEASAFAEPGGAGLDQIGVHPDLQMKRRLTAQSFQLTPVTVVPVAKDSEHVSLLWKEDKGLDSDEPRSFWAELFGF